MNISINRNSETPIYVQVKSAIKNMIVSNELVEGYKLPAERKLAEELGIHRNTVVRIYSELVSEGFLTASRQKPKGYFISKPAAVHNKGNLFFPLEKMLRYNFNDREKMFLDIFGSSNDKEHISFGGIIIDKHMCPTEGIEDIVKRMMDIDGDKNIRIFYEDETERTKENICTVLAGENMYVSPKNIQLVSETNQALNHLLTLYLSEGDVVIAEEPIVPDNASVIRNKGINLVTVPMDEDGINLELLDALINEKMPKFIYTMPNYHNPTGITMSLEKRIGLLEICHKYGIPIIEEDSQRDFRYTQQRIPSLYSLDNNKSVVYIDSFTLTFPYGIKTGYIAGPKELVTTLGRLIVVDETFVSNIGQYMLNEYIEKGFYSKHVARLADHYKRKRDLLCNELDKIKDKGISYTMPQGGILLWCKLSSDINERQLFQIAEKNGLLIMPGFLFYPHGYQGSGHLRICFSNVSDEDIVKGVEILAKAIDYCRN